MSNERIVKKIKKCLALSKSDNANEAAAALRQARALMQKHSVKVFDIDFKVPEGGRKRPPLWRQVLMSTVADALGCAVVLIDGKEMFAGQAPAPEIAEYAMTVLLRQMEYNKRECLDALVAADRSTKVMAGKAFSEGWAFGCRKSVLAFAQPLSEAEKNVIYAQVAEAMGAGINDKKLESKSSASDQFSAFTNAGFSMGKKARIHAGVNGEQGVPLLGADAPTPAP